MRVSTITGLCLCVCVTLLNSSCKHMVKEEPLDKACNNSIQETTTLLEQRREQLDKTQLSQIDNLLTAAKIHQQHQKFAECQDTAQRALLLVRHYQPHE
jgi:hypothetical protein